MDFRSVEWLIEGDYDLSHYIDSTDYSDYNKNFSGYPLNLGMVQRVTFNHTRIQMLVFPSTIFSNSEKQYVLFYYHLGKTDYKSVVVNGKGTLTNFLNLTGDFALKTVGNVNLVTGKFSASNFTDWNPTLPGTSGIPGPFYTWIGCVRQHFVDQGLGGWIATAFDPEAMFLGYGIDCAAGSLFD